MSEKVESGLEVVAIVNIGDPCPDTGVSDDLEILSYDVEFQDGEELVRQSDAELALSDLKLQLDAARSVCLESQGTILTLIAERDQRDAEIQQQHEAHRKTWRQLEQVTGLLREALPILSKGHEYAFSSSLQDLVGRIEATVFRQEASLDTLPTQAEWLRSSFMEGYQQGIDSEFSDPEAAWNRSRTIHLVHDLEQSETAPAQDERDVLLAEARMVMVACLDTGDLPCELAWMAERASKGRRIYVDDRALSATPSPAMDAKEE